MQELPDGCPACGALPCDWVSDPHAFLKIENEWDVTTADWLKIAKAAGDHGVRFRTNRALISFLNEISTGPIKMENS